MSANSLKDVLSNGGVEVMKASAGSGKTFSLTREYLRLLLVDRDQANPSYRHILAVTFTNKATDEMKSRIVKELDILARTPLKSDHLSYLMAECSFASVPELSDCARKSLSEILCDYGAFSVSTIDKFFQRVLRSFAREVGQFGEYQVELDRDSLVQEACERILDSLGDRNPSLLEWLVNACLEDMSMGERFSLEGTLYDFASEYMGEGFRARAEQVGMDSAKAFSEANLKAIRSVCGKIVRDYPAKVKTAAKEDLDRVTDRILNPKQNKNLVKRLTDLKNFTPEAFRNNFPEELPKYWTQAVEDGLVQALPPLLGKPLKEYRTAVIIRGQVAVFRLADALEGEFAALLREKDVLGIEDSNRILNDIIGGSDAPFIYEKLGVRYKNFLLDEFQDTSYVQWGNFLPLLGESISKGSYNLIVGDVKQSIYRWRNASWKILESEVQSSIPRTFVHSLDTNWRSSRKIVEFNNDFFSELVIRLDRQMRRLGIAHPDYKDIASLYNDVRQNAGKRESLPKGSVELSFCTKDELLNRTLAAVDEAVAHGFSKREIAVIVRSNRLGEDVASTLVREGYDVITNDSLHLYSSSVVRSLVSRLYLLDNPDDKVNSYFAGENFKAEDYALRWQSLTELCDTLLESFPRDEVDKDTLYVLSFMDLLKDFVERGGNSLHAFLQYWEQEGMKRSISSPEGADAITIITVHSAKGLDFPYVIVPLQKSENWTGPFEQKWLAAKLDGTPFASLEKSLYRVKVGTGAAGTYFSDDNARELSMDYVDNINVWYVALTRAVEGMHIIVPGGKDLKGHIAGEEWPDVSGLGSALKQYVIDGEDQFPQVAEGDGFRTLLFGEWTRDGNTKAASRKKNAQSLPLKYYGSVPVSGEHIRVRVKGDAADFFCGETPSARLRGSVLHSIMETVFQASELPASVEAALRSGLLSEEEGKEALEMLSKAIESVEKRGWFGVKRERILDERDIIDADGEIFRPDRVVLRPDGGVDIVDYKFGEKRASYRRQVGRYVSLYKAMGYESVRGYIWYVPSGEVVEL